VLAIQAVDLDAGEVGGLRPDGDRAAQEFPGVCARMSPRECIINALLAASAIPVAFPPVFIDSEMYVDGGLRQHGFTINLINGALHSPTATARSLDNPEGFALRLPSTPDPEAASVNLTLIANTDLEYPLTCTGNGLREIAERSAVIMIDQLAVGSFFRLLAETQSHPGSSAKFTYADPALTQCELGQSGRRKPDRHVQAGIHALPLPGGMFARRDRGGTLAHAADRFAALADRAPSGWRRQPPAAHPERSGDLFGRRIN